MCVCSVILGGIWQGKDVPGKGDGEGIERAKETSG